MYLEVGEILGVCDCIIKFKIRKILNTSLLTVFVLDVTGIVALPIKRGVRHFFQDLGILDESNFYVSVIQQLELKSASGIAVKIVGFSKTPWEQSSRAFSKARALRTKHVCQMNAQYLNKMQGIHNISLRTISQALILEHGLIRKFPNDAFPG